jgi:hypothetical protein
VPGFKTLREKTGMAIVPMTSHPCYSLFLPDGWIPILATAIIFLAAAILIWLAIKKYLQPNSPEQKKEAVTLLFQAVGGTALLLGAYFTWQQLVNSREELKNSRNALITAQQGQITERFTRAIEQLGKEDGEQSGVRGTKRGSDPRNYLAIRLGGIYALERIAGDNQPDHPIVMEVLTAFVRENSPWTEGEKKEKPSIIAPDIQAILTVIARRKLTYQNGEAQRLDLSGTDLTWANLSKAKLDGVDLTYARLDNTQLKEIELKQALLIGAHFTDAFMEGAQLQGADLRGAVLRKAKVSGADFTGANLCGADLSEAEGLTRQQLDAARTDQHTLTNLRTLPRP